MAIKSGQKYLRIRNTSSSQLYLSDLDDEENKQENKGVQVYLDAGEKTDLPMDGDVIHSYEEGSIRGFIDDGKMSAAPYDGGGNELWVGPNGDDDNPGTQQAPLASIQTAIDRLDEDIGILPPKVVHAKPGVYVENIVVNTQNLYLKLIPKR